MSYFDRFGSKVLRPLHIGVHSSSFSETDTTDQLFSTHCILVCGVSRFPEISTSEQWRHRLRKCTSNPSLTRTQENNLYAH